MTTTATVTVKYTLEHSADDADAPNRLREALSRLRLYCRVQGPEGAPRAQVIEPIVIVEGGE